MNDALIYNYQKDIIDEKDKEIERLNKRNKEIYGGFMTTTEELCEATKEIERLNNIIKEAREYHDNCINNLLDLDKIDDNERLAYKVAYEIHENYSKILGSDKE
jgi:geranylgeranyl pyrophosphate synthase